MAVADHQVAHRPAALQIVVAGVALSGAAALLLRLADVAGDAAVAVPAALLIAVAVAATDSFTLELPHGEEVERFGLTDGVWVAAVMLAPRGAATVGAAAGALAWQALRHLPLAKLVFNVGQVALAVCVAEAVWALPAAEPDLADPSAWLLGAAAGAAAFVINQTTVALVVAISCRRPVRHILFPSLRAEALHWLGAVSIGLLAVVVWQEQPLGLLLVAPPLALVYLAHREFIAGLVERERMQDLAHTAEQIARDRDPSARLPLPPGEDRLTDLTASLNRMLARLDSAFGRERRLLRMAAGRMQDPVRRLSGELDGDGPLEPAARRRLLDEAQRMGSVLEAMDRVVVAGQPTSVHVAPVIVPQFLDRVVAAAGERLDGRLSVGRPRTGAIAVMDPHWLERALVELLANAAEHASPSAHVELRAFERSGSWHFEVADDGDGVACGHETAIFEPFYQLAGGDQHPGLGLAVVRGVAEAHGGSAGVANRPGAGATFWVRIPG